MVGQIPSSKKLGIRQHTAVSPSMNQVEPSHIELYLVSPNFSIISVQGWDATYKMYHHGYGHGYADAVMPEPEMRNLDRGKHFDCACKQCGYKQDDHQPGVGIKPSEPVFHGGKHSSELSPVDNHKGSHCVPEYPVDDFQHAPGLDNYSMAFQMQQDADNHRDDKCGEQYARWMRRMAAVHWYQMQN